MYDGDGDGYYVERLNGIIESYEDYSSPESQLIRIQKGLPLR